jgi:hypothetical protein
MMHRVGQALYGAAFVFVVPALLVWWANATAEVVPLRALHNGLVGALVACVGLTLVLAGWFALYRYGRGLPMNAFPPIQYVEQGVYRFIAQPIYIGFFLACIGAAIATGSSSGLWLISPVVGLAMAALVWGYEKPDLLTRFGARAERRPLVSLPPAGSGSVTAWNRVSVIVLVFVPWIALFEAVVFLGPAPDAVVTYLPFERGWPVLVWSEFLYGSAYLMVVSTLFVVRRQSELRKMSVVALLATAIATMMYLTIPLVTPPRAFESNSTLGWALEFERHMGNTVAAFPAFHLIWSLIAAEAWSTRSRAWAAAGWTMGLLIAASCLTTGMHSILDLLAAFLVFAIARRYDRVWEVARSSAERIANTWKTWRWGRVRLINYGFYAALAGAVGYWIAASVTGPEVYGQLVTYHVFGLIGASAWAQKLEGSSKLSRPYGYYGSVIGAIVGALIVGAGHSNTPLLLAVLALEAPWIQAIGRLRCLVQGCCHGSEASDLIGIRYWDRRSRVCGLAEKRGVALHPTPLYSMVANLVTGVVLMRLWSLGASLSLIAGVYLMLAGLSRFVEEAYRGEPQTVNVWGLHIYQWIAALCFTAGAGVTALDWPAASGVFSMPDGRSVWTAALCALVVGAAMGIDFPDSDRRFARLAPR